MLNRSILMALAVLALASTAMAAPKHKAETATEEAAEQAQPQSELGDLMHASPERVKARLGDPDVARAEGKGAFWTYRLPHCALFLFFHEGPRGLRVSGAATGPRKRGEPLLEVRTCLASALQQEPPPDIGPTH